jgi:pimeloyl-ACP methyl ester carboxylesterase
MALSGIYSGMTRGFVTGTEFEAVIRPNDGTHVGRRGVIFCHGYNQDVKNGIDFNSFPGVSRLLRALAQRGVCVLSLDLGGTATFGNDTAITRIGQARTFLTAQGCATDKVLFVADSMGNWAATRYAADNPGQVAAILALEPGVDLNGVRDNNILSAQADINAAWGLAAGSTSSTVPLPTRADLLTRAAGGALNGLRYRAYYSTADVVALPAPLTTLVASIGSTADMRAVPGTPAHGAALTSAVPVTEAANWLATYAA